MRSFSTAVISIILAGSVAFAQQSQKSASAPAANAATPPATPPPAHPITDAQAKQMLEMTGATEMKAQLTHGLMNYFRTAMPFVPQDVLDDLEQSLQKADIETQVIGIYKQHISTEDADSIIAFYKTPAGKNLIQSMPVILQESQQAGLQIGRQTAQQVVDRHKEELQAAQQKYVQEHQQSKPSLNSPSQSPQNQQPQQNAPASASPKQ